MLKRSLFSAFTFSAVFAVAAHADNVEIYLVDMLDSTQSGYCVDISGGKGAQADPANGLQSHTCYSPLGELLVDQIFDTEKFADGVLFMPEFDVCVQATDVAPGATLELASCDGSDDQNFSFTGEGKITPGDAPELCFTAGEGTRSGRSDVNQIKALTLETCDDSKSAYQTWSVRSE